MCQTLLSMVIDTTAAHRRGRGGGRPAEVAPGVARSERRPGGGLAGRPDRGPAAVAVGRRTLRLPSAGRHPASRGGGVLSPLRAPGRTQVQFRVKSGQNLKFRHLGNTSKG